MQKLPTSIVQVPSSVPSFIGYTQKRKDEKIKPIKISSLLEYEQNFGKAEDELTISIEVNNTNATATIATPSIHNLYYSVRLYFDNGGGPCYIVSVGFTGSGITLTDMQVGLKAIEAFDEPTILLFPEGQALPETDYYALVSLAVDQAAKLRDRFLLIDVHTQHPTVDSTINNFRTKFSKIDNLSFAAAYYPNIKTVFNYQYQDHLVNVIVRTNGGALTSLTLDNLSSNAAVYNSCKKAISQLNPVLPPSPAIAGIYAKVDTSRGVWKSPANISINSIIGLTDNITNEDQGNMNIDVTSGKSVNAIRTFTGKGILVWGARTLAGNDNEWRYVSVRRFFIMVEESIKKSTKPFVFEPNDSNTWIKVRTMIENYLIGLWRQGALAGSTPDKAFFVKCGLGQTMTTQDIQEGRLIIEIGMAVIRPAEFIIIRFSHKKKERSIRREK